MQAKRGEEESREKEQFFIRRGSAIEFVVLGVTVHAVEIQIDTKPCYPRRGFCPLVSNSFPFSSPISFSPFFNFFFITRATLLIIQVRFFPTRNMGQNRLKAKREIAFKLGERCARYQWRVKIRLG